MFICNEFFSATSLEISGLIEDSVRELKHCYVEICMRYTGSGTDVMRSWSVFAY